MIIISKAVIDFWYEYYIDEVTGLCCLCANKGIINTRDTAISNAGVRTGGKTVYCICLNGQQMRINSVIMSDARGE